MVKNLPTIRTMRGVLLLSGLALLLASCSGSSLRAETSWFEASSSGKGPHYTASGEGTTWKGDSIGFDFILRDPDKILRGKKMPGMVNFQLLPTGCEGDIYIHDAPKDGLRVILEDCQVMKTNGIVVHRFPVPPGREKIWKARAQSWIRPIVWKSEGKPLDAPPQGDLIVLVTVRVKGAK